jgi:benzodiazapine receptor
VAAAGPPIVAAVLGNSLVRGDALRWFNGLRRPRMQIPLSAFVCVGVVYYVQLGVVLYRAHHHGDRTVRHRALLVLAGNELWNVAFFGRRSPRNGFRGVLSFLPPLLALQRSVARDRPSLYLLMPYTAWVIAYDLPWTYRLWRLNPDPEHANR